MKAASTAVAVESLELVLPKGNQEHQLTAKHVLEYFNEFAVAGKVPCWAPWM